MLDPLNCLICGAAFNPHDSRQKCCSSACGKKRYESSEEYALIRKRIAKKRCLNLNPQICPICKKEFIPKFRKQLCCCKACGAKRHHASDQYKEGVRKKYIENHDKIRAYANEKYRTDPRYSEKARAYARKQREENPEKIKAAKEKRPGKTRK